MRRTLPALVFTSALLTAAGCQQEKKDLMALPAAYDPAKADLTLNRKNLEAFNLLNNEDRRSFVKDLKGKPGSYTGQAIFQSGNGLAPTVEDSQYGTYELFAHVPDPVLYEITIDYQVFTTPEIGKPIAQNKPIAFRGTLVDLRFDDQTKPRKLTIRVKADSVETITDKTPVGASAAPPAVAPAPAPAPATPAAPAS
ncbi:MAG: hypothetical protein H0T76_02130 [Nannocystis sp.]|nr:hypothetical protein [Nannocystis sp.]MBA3545260.1 hypothetical protein [Nannocystis sp.]